MVDFAEADVFRNAEGTMRVAERPGRLSLRRGQRAGHADKDSPGTWEIPSPPSREAPSQAKASSAWAAGSRSVSYYRRSGGTIPTGPRGGKGTPDHGYV